MSSDKKTNVSYNVYDKKRGVKMLKTGRKNISYSAPADCRIELESKPVAAHYISRCIRFYKKMHQTKEDILKGLISERDDLVLELNGLNSKIFRIEESIEAEKTTKQVIL
tara:strand:+ start:12 stop:341 length:330 start_codon:yes stop_codon:yes gene_type:complete